MSTIKTNKSARYFIALFCLGLVSACTDSNSSMTTTLDQKSDPKIQIEFKEVMYMTSTQWPSDMKSDEYQLKKSNTLSEEQEVWYLTDYSVTQQQQIIDNEGYFSFEKVYLNGNGDLGLPKDMIQSATEQMPYNDEWKNPKVRTTLVDGTLSHWAADGTLLNSYAFPKEDLKIPIDSLLDVDTTDVSGNYFKLSMSFSDDTYLENIGNGLAKVQMNLSDETIADQIISLKHNQPIYSRLSSPDGKVLQESYYKYEIDKGLPLMSVEDSKFYSRLSNGEWGISSRKVINRSNIKIQVN